VISYVPVTAQWRDLVTRAYGGLTQCARANAFLISFRHGRLMLALPHGRSYVCYSRPGPLDKLGEDFDGAGHLSQSVFEEAGVPQQADVYLSGPTGFMTDMKAALAAFGVAPRLIHIEIFNGSEPMTPVVVGAAARIPHRPEDEADTGPLVSFARSGIAAHWKASAYQSLLELAERCDVPVRWACRTGVCHSVRAVWSREESSMDRNRSTNPPTATFLFAAHNRFAMSSSICKPASLWA